MRTTMIAVSSLCCIATAAQAADPFAGGPIYGGKFQKTAVCHVFNTGSSQVGFDLKGILASNGLGQSFFRDTCGSFLGASKSCDFAATIDSGISYSCQIIIAPGKISTLRGSFDIRDDQSTVLVNVELR